MKFVKLAGVGVLGLALAACNEDQKKEVSLESDMDKVSYGMGLNIGKNFKQQELVMNVDAIAAGMRDAMDGKQRLDDETIKASAEAVRDREMEKQKALSNAQSQKGKEFLAENAKREGVTTTDSGLQYEVITQGSGEGESPKATDTVSVHYHGTLIDGTVFDSSVERNQPAEFPLNAVIKGWTEALQLMKVGDKWKLYLPSEIAYGARSPSPKIPANSTLVFEVELLDIKKS
ncbi:FKBP-type peptidyl-prolyl cis-trans isomerase [Alkalimarinus coralli]|uniref:FKBP-type peptidyl-prolyl cis-trans isomerase n=1 Tax=Alkalimarinus coralli TaxID=2935863 RepID=UPI00202B91D3|nr:FKBP-type peptidyl-prolyl cis-trans isomerase [Alkalimarinus coralli]